MFDVNVLQLAIELEMQPIDRRATDRQSGVISFVKRRVQARYLYNRQDNESL